MYRRINPTTPGFFTVEELPDGMTDIVEARRTRFGWQARLHEDDWASVWVYGTCQRQAITCLMQHLQQQTLIALEQDGTSSVHDDNSIPSCAFAGGSACPWQNWNEPPGVHHHF